MNLPQQYLKNMQQLLGEGYQKYLDSLLLPCVHGLRVNCIKTDNKIIDHFLPAQKIAYTDNGFVVGELKLAKNPLHIAGLVYSQEPSSMLAVELSSLKKSASQTTCVLDMCAAPGGKTGQIAEILDGRGVLVSNEIENRRAKILCSNIERLGYTNVIVTSLSPEKLADAGLIFDYCFVDAPCSGEGMFRKNPDTIFEWHSNYIQSNSRRQKQIIACADKMLKVGGELVYSTCTFSPDENEEVVQSLLVAGNYKLNKPSKKIADATTYYSNACLRRFYPHIGAGEGQFVSSLTKIAGSQNLIAQKQLPNFSFVSKNEKLQLDKALKDIFDIDFATFYVKIGEMYYLINQNLQNYLQNHKNLPILRAGVAAFVNKNGKFVPQHNLFMAYGKYAKTKIDLDQNNALKFLHGEELPYLGNSCGYACITFLNYPIGFCRISEQKLKNCFPKGLRI